MKRLFVIGLVFLSLIDSVSTAHACSTVFFDKGNRTLIGHNMDWFADRLALVVNKRNVQKYGFVFPNDPPFTWVSQYGSISLIMEGREITGRGMNEAGLVILEMALGDTRQSLDTSIPRLSVGQWAQYQLDTSATVADVISSDEFVRISPEEEWQSQFLIWDRTGASVLIEWLQEKMVVISRNEMQVPVFVNSTFDMCLLVGDDPSGRYKKMSDRYLAYDPTTDIDDFAFVHSILEEGANMLRPPMRTLWQFILDPFTQRMFFYSHDNSNLRYLDLNDFDFSCSTPVEVFDLSEGDSGNVRSQFKPYTSSFNDELVDYIFGVYQSYGIPTSDELIANIKSFPDETICMDKLDDADAKVTDTESADTNTSSLNEDSDTSETDIDDKAGTSECGCAVVGSQRTTGIPFFLFCLALLAYCRLRKHI